MARLGPRPRDAGGRREDRCWAISPTRNSPTRAPRRRSRGATASIYVNTDGPRRQARRLRDQVHVRRASAAAVPDRISRRSHAGALHRVGLAPEGAGRTALVPSVPRAEHQGRRLAALDVASARTGTSRARNAIRPTCARTSTPTRIVYKTTWSELNVSCEACHGPGSNHVRWARKEGDWQALDATKGLVDGARRAQGRDMDCRSRRRATRSAARRGRRRAKSTPARAAMAAPARISDDYVHGKPPLDTHRLALLDDDLYWNDGQMRDEVYNWGSFVQSRMYAEGVTCSDCHDPHSLKLRAAGNAVCAQCHQPANFDSPGAHAPRRGHAGRRLRCLPHADDDVHGRRSAPRPFDAHSAARPVGEARHAQCLQQLPHASRRRAMGGRRDRALERARCPWATSISPRPCAPGRSGAPGARGALLTLIDDKTQPAIVRASAIDRLGPWMTPTMVPAVSRALNDPDAIVRLAAVEVLADHRARRRASAILPRMLADPGARGAHRSRARAGRTGRSGLIARRSRRVRARARRVRRRANVQRRPARRSRAPGRSLRGARQRGAAPSRNTARRSSSTRPTCRRIRIWPTSIARAARRARPRRCCGRASRRCRLARRCTTRSVSCSCGRSARADALQRIGGGRAPRRRPTRVSRTCTRWR